MNVMEPNGVITEPSGKPEDFLERIVEFPDGTRFERLAAITDFRKDPGEARILYLCRRKDPSTDLSNREGETFVMKIKAQWPGPQNIHHDGPSPLTNAELKSLQLFRDQRVESVPHLVTWKKAVQPYHGVFPGGYVIYTIMTLMPGKTLWDLPFWGLPDEKREEIRLIFMKKLREVRALGIAPYDCALRNMLWDEETQRLSIVDFEHYDEPTGDIEDETVEFQRWGLIKRPPPRTWFQEWGLKGL